MKKNLILFLTIILVMILSLTSCMDINFDIISDLESRIEELENEIDEKNQEIEKLKEENAEKEEEIDLITMLISKCIRELDELEDENQEFEDEILTLEEEYKAKVEKLDQDINKLEADYEVKVAELEAKIQEFINNTKYTVTFDFNDGKSEIISQTIKYGKTINKPESPEKDHYKFIGWYVNDVKAEFPYVVTCDLDFVAVYEPIKYTIQYNANGGTMPDTYTTEYTAETEIVLPIPYLDLFSFEGWYENSDFSGKKITKISADEYGNKTFYAKWKSATNDGMTYQPSADGSYLIVTGYEGTETSIVIPNSVGGIPVTHIAKEAFKDKQRLVSITIPDSITTIGGGAFRGCISLEKFSLGDGVTDIPSCMVYECTKLSSIIIPDSVTSIGGSAFYGCSGLISVEIGNNVASIGGSAFEGCCKLTNIVIPDSVTSIGYHTFADCYKLTSVTIGNSVVSIGSSVFQYCFSLDNVTLPNSVTSIDSGVFWCCESLTSVVIGDSVSSINYSAFYGCTSLTSITVDENNQYYKSIDGNLYTKDGKTLVKYAIGKEDDYFEIPDSVTSIGSSAFWCCENITSIMIGDSVTSIGVKAFDYCRNLTSIEMGNSVTSIGSEAFYQCYSLASIVIPDGVTSIGPSTFWYCESLTSIVIPASVTSIGNNAFIGCESLYVIYNNSDLLFEIGSANNGRIAACAKAIADKRKVTYASDGYEYILTDEGFLFRYKDSKYELIAYSGGKKTITLPENINDSDYDISYMRGVIDINIPEGFTTISDYAFYECSSLTSVIISNSITDIGYSSFSFCDNLIDVNFGDNVEIIGSCAFRNCTSLASVVFPNNVATIGSQAFENCSNIKTVLIGSSVSSIGNFAFYGCSSLASVVIPDSVTSIGDRAFLNCNSLTNFEVDENNQYYKSIDGNLYSKGRKRLIQYAIGKTDALFEIPDSITSIGSYAFDGCSSLTSVVIPDSVTSICSSAFNDCSNFTDVYYNGSVEDWNLISIGGGNENLEDATRYYYSETEPTESGNFWHWGENGEVVVWE